MPFEQCIADRAIAAVVHLVSMVRLHADVTADIVLAFPVQPRLWAARAA